MELNSLITVYVFFVGLALGSFINVCVYRIPLRKSIVKPPSACPKCHKRIKFYDNIPVASYLLLRGRCRHCQAAISWEYPFVETMTGLLCVGLFIKYGFTFQFVGLFLFSMTLVVISFIDLHHRIIPDILSLSGIPAGWAFSLFTGHTFWLDSLIGSAAGGGALFLVAFVYERLTGREGMGGGDIKLLAMIGAWMGWIPLPFIVLISSFTGAIVGGIFILLAGKGAKFRIPFGPFLSFGALIYLFFGLRLTSWYFGFLR